MEGTELLSFQIISNVGDAKSFLLEALRLAREEKFEEAEKLVNDAEESLEKAHKFHVKMIQGEAQGELVEVSLLLMHAEDQMMTTEMLKNIANEMILMHKKYSKK